MEVGNTELTDKVADTKLDTNKIQETIRQTILFGSVYEAIFLDLFTPTDILSYLLTVEKPTIKHYIAYRVVCAVLGDQELEGKHFLLHTDEDGYLFIFSMLKLQCNNIKVIQKMQQVFPRFLHHIHSYRDLSLLCGDLSLLTDKNATYIIAIRHLVFSNFDPENYIDNDYLEFLDYVDTDKFINRFILRCQIIRTNAPLYWNAIKKKYRKCAQKHYSNPIDKPAIECLENLFPGLYPEEILNQSNIVYEINKQDLVVKAYLLGFPVDTYLPSEHTIGEALSQLQRLGIDEYCKTVKKYNMETDNGVQIRNKENVEYERFDNLNPCDVISYCIDISGKKHLFHFSRNEFDTLLKDRKNFYTNEYLPDHVLHRIQLQNHLFPELPICRPLADLLHSLEKGENIFTDFGVDEEEEYNEEEYHEDEYNEEHEYNEEEHYNESPYNSRDYESNE